VRSFGISAGTRRNEKRATSRASRAGVESRAGLETRDDVAVLRAKYAANEWSVGGLPGLALSAEQCAARAGRLHACVLELKGVAPPTPIRKN
jgi:hypothetical protein